LELLQLVHLRKLVYSRFHHNNTLPKLLLVEDEKDIATVLKTGLEKKGYEVDAFNDPSEALSKFRANYYDVLLLDIRMPAMNGFDFCRALMEIDSKPTVAFLSAFEIYEDEVKMYCRH
jgi:DNA-binding response OmpR family regulator